MLRSSSVAVVRRHCTSPVFDSRDDGAIAALIVVADSESGKAPEGQPDMIPVTFVRWESEARFWGL
jgi:hypothetical protein